VIFVDRIKIPILNAYGFNDPRVDIDHWKRLESKLKQYNKTYEIIIEKDEGHGFRNETSRMNFYRHLEAFLARYMNDVPAGRVDVKEGKVIEMPVKGTN
jgi:dipeptidyl aminopeptidase/acylaminoacyl peptidase